MKLIGFWLLLLLAVLVPATATVAASMICPPVVAAKQHLTGAGSASLVAKSHSKSKSAAHDRSLRLSADAKIALPGDLPAKHCCDADPCSHCANCGACASLAIGMTVEAGVPLPSAASLPDPGVPRAEFLASGQERPPRRA